MKTVTNETGTFYIDGNGVLLRYESTSQNKDCPHKGPRNIINLTIPEGVQELSDNAFRGYDIFNDVKLPASLKRLGENVFSGSHIGGIALPENPDPDVMRQLAGGGQVCQRDQQRFRRSQSALNGKNAECKGHRKITHTNGHPVQKAFAEFIFSCHCFSSFPH